MQNLKPFIDSLLSFAQGRLDFKDPPKLFLKQDQENAKDVFGKTAYYDPNEKSITIFTTGRHPKDILRSIAHELVHHCQNLRGDLTPEKCGPMGIDYAQKNSHMREMEREAYEKGKEIKGISEDLNEDKQLLFHAGTKIDNGKIVTNGGRVLACTGIGDSIENALKNSYQLLDDISFDKLNYRKDIGQDLLEKA